MEGPYHFFGVAAGAVTQELVTYYNADYQSAALSEAVAMHEAVKWALTVSQTVIIHFDSKSAGEAAASRAEPPPNFFPSTRDAWAS